VVLVCLAHALTRDTWQHCRTALHGRVGQSRQSSSGDGCAKRAREPGGKVRSVSPLLQWRIFGCPPETGNLGNHPSHYWKFFNIINSLYRYIKGSFWVTSG
jgi:hypothetical protein